MRRRRDLTGWILMAVLFIGALALIFYILLMRAQHLGSMEQQRNEPQAQIVRISEAYPAVVMIHSGLADVPTPYRLVFEASVA